MLLRELNLRYNLHCMYVRTYVLVRLLKYLDNSVCHRNNYTIETGVVLQIPVTISSLSYRYLLSFFFATLADIATMDGISCQAII